MKLVLLFTRFPVSTETFLQREVRALSEAGVELDVWSLWGGESSFEGTPVRCIRSRALLGLLWWIPYWLCVRPRRMGAVFGGLFGLRWRNAINFGENLLGLGLGVVYARLLSRHPPTGTHLHAVWASLPAAFGWTVAQLTDLPFTFAGHAYDLFENGGDGLMRQKFALAGRVRTSTEAGVKRLAELKVPAERVVVIRRGLDRWPEPPPMRSPRKPIRVVAVGRFVPKMGFGLFAEVLDELSVRGIPFAACVVGDGPDLAAFRRRARQAPWGSALEILGAQPFERVEEVLAWGDLLLFTGVVAKSGDRAGFPNIIGEAMAMRRPVVATPVGAVPEVVREGETGLLGETREALAEAIILLAQDDAAYNRLAEGAYAWVRSEFDAHRNMARFMHWIDE